MRCHGPAFGIIVSGVPIGDERFVSHHLVCKAEETVSTVKTIREKLPDRHLQALWSMTYHCLQHKFQYFIQHVNPGEVQGAATLVDEALLTVVTCCMSSDVRADGLAVRRLRLPAKIFLFSQHRFRSPYK